MDQIAAVAFFAFIAATGVLCTLFGCLMLRWSRARTTERFFFGITVLVLSTPIIPIEILLLLLGINAFTTEGCMLAGLSAGMPMWFFYYFSTRKLTRPSAYRIMKSIFMIFISQILASVTFNVSSWLFICLILVMGSIIVTATNDSRPAIQDLKTQIREVQ